MMANEQSTWQEINLLASTQSDFMQQQQQQQYLLNARNPEV